MFSANNNTIATIGRNTLQLSATDTSHIDVSGAISGTGSIVMPDHAISAGSALTFDSASPNFNGKVVIGAGDRVSISNESTVTSNVNAFGASNITIMNGGALVLFAAGTSSFTVSNSLLVSGNGVNDTDGSTSGAVSACVTSAEEGCGADESIIFTGNVKLLGDTQIDESTPLSLGAPNTHVSYTFNNLDKNNHMLNIISDYYFSTPY